MMPNAHRVRGFTMMEFILVIGLTGILIVGLGAIVEIPREIAQSEVSGEARTSSVDRAVKWLDDDIRFAKDVATSASTELQVTRKNGTVVTYNWGGAGTPLVRTAAEGTAEMVGKVSHLGFCLGLSELRVGFTEGTVSESLLETATFDSFTLQPGYGFAGLLPVGSLLTPVIVDTLPKVVGPMKKVGIVFKATGLADDDAFIESIRLRLRRAGTGGVFVSICEALESPYRPNYFKYVTGTWVDNAALPAAMSDFTIALPPQKKIQQGKTYFIDLTAPPFQTSVEVESRTLSVDAAATASSGGLVYSTNGGFSYSPVASVLDASQTVFSVTAKKTVAETTGSAGDIVMIPTCVQMTIHIETSDGVSRIDTSFPVENNLALVNR